MDGLESSEINCSKVFNTSTLRYDSEYYQKEYLLIDRYLKNNKDRFLNAAKLGLTVDASAFYPSLEPYYNKGETPFIRVSDVKTYINYETCVKIPQMGDDFKTLNLCHLGDIVLTKGGRVGTAGLITQDSYVTRDLIFINSSKLKRIDYVSLYLYLCTHFAYKQMIRSSSMTAQPHLTITLIRDLPIFNFSIPMKQMLLNVYEYCENMINNSKSLYNYANKILEKELNIYKFNDDSKSIKSISNSFLRFGRLDAEYYQPIYDKITQTLNTNDTIKSLCTINDQNYSPKDESRYQYIELANVGISGEISDVEVLLGKDLPSRARQIVKAGQVIVSSVEGSLQSCALVTDEFDGALCSTGFYVVDSNSINSETLLILFKSKPIQALMKQRCSGTILTAINKEEFASIPFPQIDLGVQEKISKKVKESFELRRKSKSLLEYAKIAVEIAIEQSEEDAIAWLKERCKEVEV